MSPPETFANPTQRTTTRVIIVALTFLTAVSLLPTSQARADTVDPETAACLVDQVNRARTAEGLGTLTVVDSMVHPSTAHTSRMLEAGDLFHARDISRGAPTPWYWVGENVGYGGDCISLHRAFMNSRGHRNNILKPEANGIAVGAIEDGGRVWVTVRFVHSPAVQSVAPGPFADVAADHTFVGDITRLADSGVTRGCNPPDNTRFCPDRSVTRAEMAAFLVRALSMGSGAPGRFTDVPADHEFHADIAALADADITRGCNPPENSRFCPDQPITRAQMAAFLVRALDLPAGSVPDFIDVASDHVFARDIAALAAAGITRGCGDPADQRFCPNRAVTRAEMAAFLVRAGTIG